MSKAAVLRYRDKLRRDLHIVNTIRVLKEIAVSEYHFLEQEKKEASQFLQVVETFFDYYVEMELKDSPFFWSPTPARAIVVLSSDESFFGHLNNQIVQKVSGMVEDYPRSEVMVLGRRGAKKLEECGIPSHEFAGVSYPLTYESVVELKRYLLDRYVKGDFGVIEIVYARSHSITRQEVVMQKLLPFKVDMLEAGSTEVRDEAGFAEVEPNVRSIIEYTVALWLGRKLYDIFWESKLSEAACRAIELNERSNSLERLQIKTRIRYQRACHEVIDTGIREVFASHRFFAKLAGKVKVKP